MAVQPVFSRLLSILNNSRIQTQNPALYEYLKQLLYSNSQSQDAFGVDLKGLEDLIKNVSTDVTNIKGASVLTTEDESDIFGQSRQLLSGTGIIFDDTVDGIRIINATGGGTSTGPTFITRESPSGVINGTNATFTLANTPTAGSEEVYLNGLLQEPGAGNDYTISGATITYLTPPVSGDRIRVSYHFG